MQKYPFLKVDVLRNQNTVLQERLNQEFRANGVQADVVESSLWHAAEKRNPPQLEALRRHHFHVVDKGAIRRYGDARADIFRAKESSGP